MHTLVIIPARGGSKGIPHKNIKPLGGRPLILHTVDVAREVADDADICVSTDDPDIISCVESCGLKVPFVRPTELATDSAGTREVMLHALDFYERQGCHYDMVLLLQATSPFRNASHVREALALYRSDLDMVVSVRESSSNPYFNCFEDDGEGLLQKTIRGVSFTRRQDAPVTYEYNGAIYVINAGSLKARPLGDFTRKVKYLMDPIHSVDLDTMLDWKFAEFILKEGLL